jgi:membrane protease YdiL (CAAX protease family)
VDEVQKGLVKVAIPLAGIVLVLLRARRSGMSAADIGFVRPVWSEAALWFALYIAWTLGTDALIQWRGPWDFTPWLAMTFFGAALRVMAVCVVGPIAEELIFRGWLLHLARKTRLGDWGAVIAVAAAWAVIHYSYSPAVIGVIFVDGLLLGIARLRTRSIYAPIAMHIAYNLYAVW